VSGEEEWKMEKDEQARESRWEGGQTQNRQTSFLLFR
jgi:hypothetical protein